MLEKLFVGVLLVICTTIVQAAFMLVGLRFLHRRFAWVIDSGDMIKAVVISMFTAWMFVGVVAEGIIWAVYYVYSANIDLPDAETAFYFSMVTFATLGYGDVVLTGSWRILATMQAANGAILFGWTTALIFYVIQKLYRYA